MASIASMMRVVFGVACSATPRRAFGTVLAERARELAVVVLQRLERLGEAAAVDEHHGVEVAALDVGQPGVVDRGLDGVEAGILELLGQRRQRSAG